jgi:hypothetical protein
MFNIVEITLASRCGDIFILWCIVWSVSQKYNCMWRGPLALGISYANLWYISPWALNVYIYQYPLLLPNCNQWKPPCWWKKSVNWSNECSFWNALHRLTCEQSTELIWDLWYKYINPSVPTTKCRTFTFKPLCTTIETVLHFVQDMMGLRKTHIHKVIRIMIIYSCCIENSYWKSAF